MPYATTVYLLWRSAFALGRTRHSLDLHRCTHLSAKDKNRESVLQAGVDAGITELQGKGPLPAAVQGPP